jgi:ribosomal protein L28
MANVCQITGKKTQIGGKYSNRTRATQFNPSGKTERKPNLQAMSVYVPELDKKVKLKKVSAAGKRIIVKKGPYQALKDAKLI